MAVFIKTIVIYLIILDQIESYVFELYPSIITYFPVEKPIKLNISVMYEQQKVGEDLEHLLLESTTCVKENQEVSV